MINRSYLLSIVAILNLVFASVTHPLDIALGVAKLAAPIAASALGKNSQTIHHIHSMPSASAEKLSEATEKLISNDLDSTLTEAEILKAVPAHEKETAVKRIALQRILQKKLNGTIASQASTESVQSVLNDGANINGRHEHKTALIQALEIPNNDIARFLLSRGASPHLPETSKYMTPLHVTARTNNLSMTKELVEKYKVDLNAKTKPAKSWTGSQESAQTPCDMATGETHSYLFDKKPALQRYVIYLVAGTIVVWQGIEFVKWVTNSNNKKASLPSKKGFFSRQ